MSNTPIAQVAVSTIKGSDKQDIYPKTVDKAVLTTDTLGNEKTLDKVLIKGIEVNGTPITPGENGVVDISGVGKSAYQSYVDTTTDNPPMSEEEWVDSLNGEDGVGFSSTSSASPADGTFIITLSNDDTITVNLNHNHPQYLISKTITNTTDSTVTLSSDTIYDLGTVAGDKVINLPTTVDAAAEYEFRLAYTSGTISGTAISGTIVANDATLTFTTGKTYQVIISGGLLYFSETTTPS